MMTVVSNIIYIKHDKLKVNNILNKLLSGPHIKRLLKKKKF